METGKDNHGSVICTNFLGDFKLCRLAQSRRLMSDKCLGFLTSRSTEYGSLSTSTAWGRICLSEVTTSSCLAGGVPSGAYFDWSRGCALSK